MNHTSSTKPTRRTVLRYASTVPALAVLPSVFAQSYPSKPITLLVPYAVGGATDILARHFGRALSEILGQPVVIQNQGGAAGLIGIRTVVNAAPDGYTILYTTSVVAINPLLDPQAGYRFEDLVTLGSGGEFPYALLANEKVPFRTVPELVAYAKANPGKLNYASLGKGSPTQLFMARFMAAAGIQLVEIQYKGAAPAVQDLAGGQVQLQFIGATAANLRVPHSIPIGFTSEERLSLSPNIGTFREAGYPSMVGGTWFGFFAPAKTPELVVQRVRAAIATAFNQLKDMLAEQGTFPVPGTPEQFSDYIHKDTAGWAADIRRLSPAK